jgi:type IV pilus assembly protein PilA
MKDIHKKKSGFTLIELLIVVAIIGILASVAIPVFRDYTKRGYNSAALSDLRNLKSQMEAYFSDTHVYPAF